MINSLSAAQQQLKSRSKMHEMAVRQRLITDQIRRSDGTVLSLGSCFQDPRSQGLVQLSAEERRTLIQEGYPLSAQESRRKRKEYMDTLESRCQAYFNENSQLKNRVRVLEANNQKLSSQVKKLQEIVGNGAPHSDLPVAH
ncbi:hypothetical protein TELCIR_02253 [Teladorsagia circumcincta]|uniref:BZIP domain-containing protein n=1 Tax=Teladorsagia circumcincta TaxID=45464 RepID=A0A2G9UZQ5_TELCI|nr:hypothetical protein TELCIR_02253 [Teladorsagia circumcincta]